MMFNYAIEVNWDWILGIQHIEWNYIERDNYVIGVFYTQYTKHYVFILLNQYHTLWPKRWFMVFNATFNSISVTFLADLAKGNVSYCHQLVLRLCHPSVNFSYFNRLLYKDCSFRPDPLTNMATTGNSCFWLVDF